MIRNNFTVYHWIVFWGVLSIVFTTLDTGDWAAIISALILISGLIGGWIKFQWNRAHPFIMKVSLDPYEFKSSGKTRRLRHLVKQVDLDLGDNKILIYLSPRKGTSWDRVNMRFVNRKLSFRFNRLWKYEDSDPDIIQVTDFEDVEYREKGEDWGRSYFESQSDGVGGFSGIYSRALPVKEGELVWFHVYVRVNDSWKGFASFEGALENRRAWRRIKAEVNMPRGSSRQQHKRIA